MTAFVRSGRPGWRLRTANPLIAGGPDRNAVIQIRDRFAAHAEGPAPTTRWCVCLNLHYQIGASRRRPAGPRFFFAFYRRLRLLRGAARSSSSICNSVKRGFLRWSRLDDRRGLRHAPRPRTTIRSCISKSLLGKYTIEFSSRRDRVSFELHDRRPIVAAIQRGVLDPSPET
jgi:hypothetical protein